MTKLEYFFSQPFTIIKKEWDTVAYNVAYFVGIATFVILL